MTVAIDQTKGDGPRIAVKPLILGAALAIFLTLAFYVISPPGGDDWDVFYHAARRVLSGDPLYGEPILPGYYYYNAPWLAVLFTPLTAFPSGVGRSVLSVATIILTSLVVRRWGGGPFRCALALLSPPVFYILLHGQVDALVLAGVLLPPVFWGLVGLTKPQCAVGLLFGGDNIRTRWRMLILTMVILLLSILSWGPWPLAILRQPEPVGMHNIWLGLRPFQISAGLGIAFWGMNRGDERFLIASSPFLVPYAATSSLLGPWLVMSSLLSEWQATAVLVAWWGAVAYRYVAGL